MINGFYSSAAGMLGQLEQQDAISNNLANVNTPGYKRTSVSFSAFSAELAAASRTATTAPPKQATCVIPIPFTEQDNGQGPVINTSDPANLAIEGSGQFVVSDGVNQEFTRSGSFRLDNYGHLVTSEGRMLMGQNGPVRIIGSKWSIEPDGSVKVDGAVIDKLLIHQNAMTRSAAGLSTESRVLQGHLESSNVSVVKEMVSMLTALRAYEANQRSIQALDQTLDKIIRLPGRNT